MYLLRLLVLTIIVSLLSSCSSQPNVKVKFQHDFPFEALNSYRLYNRNSSFSDYQSLSDTTRNGIEIAIEKAFDEKGFQYQATKKSDVIIGYHIINQYSELKKYNQGVKFCSQCLHGNKDEKNKMIISPGSLIIDIVNNENKRTVWRAVAPLEINEKDNNIEIQHKIQLVVNSMLNFLPNI